MQLSTAWHCCLYFQRIPSAQRIWCKLRKLKLRKTHEIVTYVHLLKSLMSFFPTVTPTIFPVWIAMIHSYWLIDSMFIRIDCPTFFFSPLGKIIFIIFRGGPKSSPFSDTSMKTITGIIALIPTALNVLLQSMLVFMFPLPGFKQALSVWKSSFSHLHTNERVFCHI